MQTEMSKRRRALWGFSMVEVLMAVAIVAVLTALLVPAVRSAKERTKTVRCLDKLRQIGSGMMIYASEKGGFPHSSHYDYWADWGESLIPYMENGQFRNEWVPGEPWANGLFKKVGTFQHLANEAGQGTKNATTGQIYFPGWSYFTCPSGPASKQGCSYMGNGGIHVWAHHYSANEYLLPSNWNGNYVGGMPIPQVKPGLLERPGSLILVADGGVDGLNEAYDTFGNAINDIINDFVTDPNNAPTRGSMAVTTPAANDNDSGTGAGWPIYSRHGGRCNALMADGHVQAFKNGEIQRRNFVSKGITKRWGGPADYVRATYP